MISALDLFPSSTNLSINHVDNERSWRTSQITPMGGRIIFERLLCPSPSPLLSSSSPASSSTSTSNRASNPTNHYSQHDEDDEGNKVFIRINVNDGIVAIPTCHSGPGSSCPLDALLEMVHRRGKGVGNFREVCRLGEDAADRITFLHQ